jgi:ferritin-like metal-binding protein YciE
MFERLHTPEELFSFKLGSALKMENTVLEMLGELQSTTQREELRNLFAHHAEETKGQIANIERCFQLLGQDPDESPCPAIEGLEKEGKSTFKKTDDSIVDNAVLSGAAETEHHEIAVYQSLITNAEANGQSEIASLLHQNLSQEQHTLEEVSQASQRIAREAGAAAAH